MRTENSIRNSAFALGGQFVSLLTGFIMRTVFVHTLGDDYLGLNGLFTSILSMLSLTELGLGTAVSFALYKPCLLYTSKTGPGICTARKK